MRLLAIWRGLVSLTCRRMLENWTNRALAQRLLALAREHVNDDQLIVPIIETADLIASGVASRDVFRMLHKISAMHYWNRPLCKELKRLADDLQVRRECGYMLAKPAGLQIWPGSRVNENAAAESIDERID